LTRQGTNGSNTRTDRRPSPGRARNALIWSTLFFAAVQVGLLVLREHHLPELRDREYALKLALLRHRLKAEPRRPLVLLLGSSRMAVGVRPDFLPSCRTADGRDALIFNFATLGAGPITELLWLHRLLDDGVRPDYVVVEYWPPYWCQEGEAAEEKRVLRVDRLTWDDLSVLRRFSRRPLSKEWCLSRLTACSSDRYLLLKRFAPSWLPADPLRHDQDRWQTFDNLGWLPYLQPWEDISFRPPASVVESAQKELQSALGTFAASEVSARAMKEMLALCRHNNIRTLLLYLPEAEQLRQEYPEAVRGCVDDTLRRLCADWSVPAADTRGWSADADFSDGHHLYPRGAVAYSRRFGAELLRPFLAVSISTPSVEILSEEEEKKSGPWVRLRPVSRVGAASPGSAGGESPR